MLSDAGQTQEGTSCVLPLTGGPRGVRGREDGGARGWGGGDGDRESAWHDEEALEVDAGDGCTA